MATHRVHTLINRTVPHAKHGPWFPRPRPAVTPTNRPEPDSRTREPRAKRAPPPSRLHPVSGRLAGLCAPCPAPSLRAHPPVSGAEAAARPGAGRGRPAAGLGPGDSPSRRGPHPRSGTGRGGCGEWRLHGSARALAAAAPLGISGRLPGTPPWPRPALQRPARRDPREGGWLTAGGGSLESLC